MTAAKDGKITNSKVDKAFTSAGFNNWKDAISKFSKHQTTDSHREAVERLITLPKQTRDIGETLSAEHHSEKKENRQQLLIILRSIRFLARQGLPLRGHDNQQSNLIQLLKLQGESDTSILKWLEKKSEKYTCGDIQNEIIQIMALGILREVAGNIKKNGFFTIMADETADQSNREQVVIVLRHVDSELVVHEEFMGLYTVGSIDSNTLTSVIKDTILRMTLSLSNCRGQCYDGASNMSGAKKGVAANISAVESRAIYTHCYGHALNLAIGDTMKASKVMRDTMDTVYEISKLIKYSPKRNAKLQELKHQMCPDTPGFRTLCPTRWTVRAASLESVLLNYTVLQSLWEECYESIKDSELRARVIGVQTKMRTFDFLFGVCFGHDILRHTDNLSKALQHKEMSAAEGQLLSAMTIDTLRELRCETAYDSFWARVNEHLDKFDVDEPVLPRQRKMPKRFETGSAPCEYPTTVKDMYRQKYFEAFDLVTTSITERFDQPGYKTYRHLEDMLLKCVAGDPTYVDDMTHVVDFYGSDIEKSSLSTQLETLRVYIKNNGIGVKTLNDIVSVVRSMKSATKMLFSEVVTVLTLILVMPATNATSERSFSALRRVKTYLRANMTQERLNHLMLLHVHREATDDMDLNCVANMFVMAKESRTSVFGRH